MRKFFVAICLAAFATVASADPMVNCISGCGDQRVGKLKADTQLSDMWWLGPSVGMAIAARDNATGAWESNIAFTFSYGLKWRPVWWTATKTFLSFDLGLQAGTTDVTSPQFAITLAPFVTILDWIAIGYGPRIRFNDATSVSGVLFLGLSTSFGSPN